MSSSASCKVLVLSKAYPNQITPVLGVWVQGLVEHLKHICEVKVISPVPYCPPLPGLPDFTKFRSVKKNTNANGVDVYHPRFITGPGYSTYNHEATSYYWSIRRQVDDLRRRFKFDIIHANFSYPDGIVAAKLATKYNVPFVITEHVAWSPWMETYPKVRRQALQATSRCSYHIAVSNFTKNTIAKFTGNRSNLIVVPNGVDTKIFNPLPEDETPDLNQILCVGLTRHVKGFDILLKAMSFLVKENPDLKLIIVGGGFNRSYKSEELKLHRLSDELGLTNNVKFVGFKSLSEIADYMKRSALLVSPSRRETFGAVLIEALACGTPVVATDCGGPADIINKEVGMLVPVENPKALSDSILTLLNNRNNYDCKTLSRYADDNFSWRRIAEQTAELYARAIKSNAVSLS